MKTTPIPTIQLDAKTFFVEVKIDREPGFLTHEAGDPEGWEPTPYRHPYWLCMGDGRVASRWESPAEARRAAKKFRDFAKAHGQAVYTNVLEG